MPPPPPPEGAYERAWELYGPGRGWREVARILKDEGWPCGSHETARQWGYRGKKLLMTKKDLDPAFQKYRTAAGLDLLVSALLAAAEDPQTKYSILDVADHLKWIYRERAKLIGTDFRPQDAARTEPVEPQGFIQDMVRRGAPDPEELYGNGRR